MAKYKKTSELLKFELDKPRVKQGGEIGSVDTQYQGWGGDTTAPTREVTQTESESYITIKICY
jgi:hypothetical protein